MHQYPVI